MKHWSIKHTAELNLQKDLGPKQHMRIAWLKVGYQHKLGTSRFRRHFKKPGAHKVFRDWQNINRVSSERKQVTPYHEIYFKVTSIKLQESGILFLATHCISYQIMHQNWRSIKGYWISYRLCHLFAQEVLAIHWRSANTPTGFKKCKDSCIATA